MVDLSKYKIRTDIAIEEVEGDKDSDKRIIDTINMYGNKVSKVVVDEDLSASYNKKEGLYYTIETTQILEQDSKTTDNLILTIKDVLVEILHDEGIEEKSSCLIIGLGNKEITPDALGPLVSSHVTVTSHIFELEPAMMDDGFRRVFSFIPGVMGQTGIETSNIVKSIVNEIKPDFVIVVDALASRSIERVNKTIQITNAGINPGSGVGNTRKEISKEELGIPVIAIGVPTVVDAVSITSDTIDYILKYLNNEIEENSSRLIPKGMNKLNYSEINTPSDDVRKKLFGEIGILGEEEKREIIHEALTPNGLNMMVTPKEVDTSIVYLAEVLANSIDKALHVGLN